MVGGDFSRACGKGQQRKHIFVAGEDRIALPEDHGNHLLIRCFNKNADQVDELLRRCRDRIHPYFPLSGILLVIDRGLDEERGADTLGAVRANRNAGLPVVPLSLRCPRPNWAPGLNGGLEFLKDSGVHDGNVLVMSFDSVPSNPEALLLLTDDPVPVLSVRNTPAPYAPASALTFLRQNADAMRRGAAALLSQVHTCWQADEELPQSALELTPVLWRNTLTVWRIRTLLETGGFDPFVGKTGGQEDTAKVFELMLRGMTVLRDSTPVLVFDDLRYDVAKPPTPLGTGETHTDKYLREMHSTAHFLQRLRATNLEIPREDREFI